MATALPDRDHLPLPLAPLPEWLEDFALRWAWVIVAINLAGTAFGFWYYVPQFSAEPAAMWPFVPDSPLATLFIAASLAAWKLGRPSEYLNALAFFGCIVLGLWTPYVLLAFREGFSYLHWAMYNFLFWSHLAMVVEAFVIHRYSDFPLRAVGLAVAWYGGNVVLDYFVPVVGTPHHTLVPGQELGTYVGAFLGKATFTGPIMHLTGPHRIAAAGAVAVVLLATMLALATRVKKLENATN